MLPSSYLYSLRIITITRATNPVVVPYGSLPRFVERLFCEPLALPTASHYVLTH